MIILNYSLVTVFPKADLVLESLLTIKLNRLVNLEISVIRSNTNRVIVSRLHRLTTQLKLIRNTSALHMI